MGILKRFKDIMSSNINALLDKAEDPEKMIDQYLRDLQEDLRKVKSETATVMAELPELLARCEKRTKGAVKMWLHSLNEDVSGGRDKPFGELWRDSIVVLSDLSAVRADVVEEIGRLGDILGDMDVDAQISRISLIENIITDKYERERNRNGGIRKLSNSLGILAGLFIVIMLL